MTHRIRITGVLRPKADGFLRMDCGAGVQIGSHVVAYGGGYEALYEVIGLENDAHVLKFTPRTLAEVSRSEPVRAAR
jgi:hypothetical protein